MMMIFTPMKEPSVFPSFSETVFEFHLFMNLSDLKIPSSPMNLFDFRKVLMISFKNHKTILTI